MEYHVKEERGLPSAPPYGPVRLPAVIVRCLSAAFFQA